MKTVVDGEQVETAVNETLLRNSWDYEARKQVLFMLRNRSDSSVAENWRVERAARMNSSAATPSAPASVEQLLIDLEERNSEIRNLKPSARYELLNALKTAAHAHSEAVKPRTTGGDPVSQGESRKAANEREVSSEAEPKRDPYSHCEVKVEGLTAGETASSAPADEGHEQVAATAEITTPQERMNEWWAREVAERSLSSVELAEMYISELKWSDKAVEFEKTLVAGNIRGFAAMLDARASVDVHRTADRAAEIATHEPGEWGIIPANNGTDVVVSGSLLVVRKANFQQDAMAAVLSHDQARQVIAALERAHALDRVVEPPADQRAYETFAYCPITGRPFFMNLEHPEMGEVPTFGGPFDSYTIPEVDDDGCLSCERYDHDAGQWIEGCETLQVYLTTEQPCNHDLPSWVKRHHEADTIPCRHTEPPADSPGMREQRDELSVTIETCHKLLDIVTGDDDPNTTSLEPLDLRLKEYLFPEGRITDDMVNGDD